VDRDTNPDRITEAQRNGYLWMRKPVRSHPFEEPLSEGQAGGRPESRVASGHSEGRQDGSDPPLSVKSATSTCKGKWSGLLEPNQPSGMRQSASVQPRTPPLSGPVH